MFSLSESVESGCPFCPYEQTSQFIEVMYRRGYGTWEQLEEYCFRLKRFRQATDGSSEWVRERFSKLIGIPTHHANAEARSRTPVHPQIRVTINIRQIPPFAKCRA
jgi:hypothetical protein